MAKSSATRDELIYAIEQLTEQVRLLGNIIDDLTNELQWQNRNRSDATPKPFILTSLPANPTAQDWRVNELLPEAVPQPAESAGRLQRQTLFD